MHIRLEIYKKIIESQNMYPPETGGILGGRKGIVTEEYFDRGMQSDRMCSYIPNIRELNKVIRHWQMEDIVFMGIYHTHFWNVQTLSETDKEYINKILGNMPPELKKLYFPVIVMPDKKMIGYSAERIQEKLVVVKEEIVINGNGGTKR